MVVALTCLSYCDDLSESTFVLLLLLVLLAVVGAAAAAAAVAGGTCWLKDIDALSFSVFTRNLLTCLRSRFDSTRSDSKIRDCSSSFSSSEAIFV